MFFSSVQRHHLDLRSSGIKHLFAEYRIDVTVVSTGKNTDDVIASFKPDIILLDIYLNNEDGGIFAEN
jgi:response regulator of citrate/malate metabolism